MSVLFDSQLWMLGFSVQYSVHLLMHPVYGYYGKKVFPLFVYMEGAQYLAYGSSRG